MDSLFNYVIFLIPVAIFIGRAVTEARRRRNPKPQPPIPVHFEDEDEDDTPRKFVSEEHSGGLNVPGQIIKKQVYPVSIPLEKTLQSHKLGNLEHSMTDTGKAVSTMHSSFTAGPRFPLQPAQGGTFAPGLGQLNLNNLSPLKQAVVMAEILGPPKGIA